MIVMIVKISVVLHGGWILWNVAPFRILDEFDVFMDMDDKSTMPMDNHTTIKDSQQSYAIAYVDMR